MTRRERLLAMLAVMLLCLIMLTACESFNPDRVVEPKDVTVSEALADIGKGFVELDKALGDKTLGVYPCKIAVSLNVKASAKETGKLTIDLSTSDSIAKAGGERSGETTAERGNTIQVEMYNPGCLPKDTLGYHKPDQIDEAMSGMAVTEEMVKGAIRNLLLKIIPLGHLEK